MNADQERLNQITEKIIGCAFTVSNGLGAGFLEKVYENALAHELRKAGLSVQQQHPVQVRYDAVVVGDYVADVLVEDCALVELKAVKTLDDIHCRPVSQLPKGNRFAALSAAEFRPAES